MSIAFQALVLFALALPGIIFLRTSSRAGFLRKKGSVTDDIAASLVVAAISHAIWAPVATAVLRWCTGTRSGIDLDAVLMLSLGQFGKDNAELNRVIQSMTKRPYWIAWYFIPLFIASFAIGKGIAWARGKQRWVDAICGLFEDEPLAARRDEWNLDLFEHERDDKSIVRLLAAVVNCGGTAYLYAGFLDRVASGDDGHPHHFVLKEAHRRRLDPPTEWYSIKGDNFFLHPSEATTLNLWRIELRRP
jgi:hypothetical protein